MDLLTFSSKPEIISFQITNEKFTHFGIFQNEIVFLSKTEEFTHDSIVLLLKAESQYFGKLLHISDDLWCLNTALNEMLLFSQNEVTILGQVFSIAKIPI